MSKILSMPTTDVTCIECGGETKRFHDEVPPGNKRVSGNPRVHILHHYECSIGLMLRANGIHPGIEAGEISYATPRKRHQAS